MATRGSGENARISGDASRSVQCTNVHMGAASSRPSPTAISWLVNLCFDCYFDGFRFKIKITFCDDV